MEPCLRLESFIDNVLKANLHTVLRRRDNVYDQVSQCCQLQAMLCDANSTQMKAMSDLGCGFFVECKVDAETIHVNLGCGVILQMNLADAATFLRKKEELLRKEGARLTKEALRIKYRIHLVLEAINRITSARLSM